MENPDKCKCGDFRVSHLGGAGECSQCSCRAFKPCSVEQEKVEWCPTHGYPLPCAKCGYAKGVEDQKLAENLSPPLDWEKLLLTETIEVLEELIDLMETVREHEYQPDSFTTQPAKILLAKVKQAVEGK